jgi:hypothetical protein
MNSRGTFFGTCVALSVCVALPTFAQTSVQDFSISTAFGWSDNIRGEYVDQESEYIAGAGVQARLVREHRRLNYDLSADLQYLDYLHDTYENEVSGFAMLEANAILVPEVLTLVLEDNFGQMQTTPFSPSTPATRQNVNVVAVGPDLRLEMGDALVFLASGRYLLEQYETTLADNARQQGQAGLYHEFSRDSSIGVLAQFTHVDYDDGSTGTDFDRNEALVRYHLTARRTSMLLEGGRSEFSADDGLERDLWLYRVDISREITPRTRLIFATGRELSDSGSLFVGAVQAMETGGNASTSLSDLGLGSTQLSGTGIVATTDALAHRYVRGTWRLNAPRTRAYISAEQREERFLQGASVDRDVRTISAGVERSLNSALRLGLDISHNTRESDQSSIVLKDLSFRLSAFWQPARRLEISLAAERSQREEGSTGGGFDDNRVWLRAIWSPRGATN